MKNLINVCGLNKIQNFEFVRIIEGGKASSTFLYKNKKKEKILIKMLIAPRSEHELDFFKNESLAIERLSNYEGLCFVPSLLIKLTKVKNFPIWYFGIEYLEGETLSSLIKNTPPPWQWYECIDIIHRISVSLSGCSVGYVHRDLHPGNIFITNMITFDKYEFYIDPGVRILDYGCSKDKIKFQYYGTLNEDKFRHIGAISTWSPEFISWPDKVDSYHDSWAIGVLLFYLLTGNYPIYAENFGELISKIRNEEIDWSLISHNTPNTVILLVKNLLSIHPEKRFLCGQIASTCAAISFTNLNELSDDMIELFFKGGGGLNQCIRCWKFIGRSEASCPHCGNNIGIDEFVPVLQNKLITN